MVVCGQVFWESKKKFMLFLFQSQHHFFSFKERYSKLRTAHISPSGCRRKTRNVKKKKKVRKTPNNNNKKIIPTLKKLY